MGYRGKQAASALVVAVLVAVAQHLGWGTGTAAVAVVRVDLVRAVATLAQSEGGIGRIGGDPIILVHSTSPHRSRHQAEHESNQVLLPTPTQRKPNP